MTFDTLAFCKRLEDGGVPPDQAEAHARAQADFLADYLLSEMATKSDLKELATELKLGQSAIKDELKLCATKDELKRFATKDDLKHGLELLSKTLTIRLGGMVFLGIGALAALLRF